MAAYANRSKKSLEEIYQKKTQLEHILLRPDSYVGSCEMACEKMWIYDKENSRMVQKNIDYSPALYKIFDEVLVNAADNFQRDPKGMDEIRVVINREEGFISVYNNGQSLPIEMHKREKCYVPELVFGHLLTSDNYDDQEKKTVGGRNGYGAKLTNIFSTKFIVECGNQKKKNSMKYYQMFENNMTTKHPPKIQTTETHSFTKVTFYPDFPKFNVRGLTKDICQMMERRVVDMAGITSAKCKVYLNDELVPVPSFKEFVDLFFVPAASPSPSDGEDEAPPPPPKVYAKLNDRWEVCMSLSDTGQFTHVSFVNGISTIKGGTHVDHVASQLVESILKKVKTLGKGGMEIKPAHVRNQMMLFVNCLVECPAFSSQTKEQLTSKASSFGSTCDFTKQFLTDVAKSGVVDAVMHWAKYEESRALKRKVGGKTSAKRLMGIPKLDDANDAGGKHSDECTLILTEGDSAKTLVTAGFEVIGRDKYGVFALRGKPLNVRDASHTQVMGNAEIQNIMKIMGLDTSKKYDDTSGLRYGSIMIMADQDYDGSHIKGLLINMIQHWWPSLFKMPGFIREFITPIVKAKKGDRVHTFFTMKEYEEWKHDNNDGKGWDIKYYKGLGTSLSKEAKEYFADLDKHMLTFEWKDHEDTEVMDLAFNKKRSDDRKRWLNEQANSGVIDHSKPSVRYTDFVHKELVHFARYDVYRMIPSIVDGLKPSQRKVLFTCLKRKVVSDSKVAQLSGSVSQMTQYHHGEASLQQTIVNMAQDYVGSNNINLLVPSGQFGTRLLGGKDAASARYIFTRLSPLTRMIFHPDDDPILDYLDEEGQRIEPRYYVPIIPIGLVNGSEGLGVGWSTYIPNFDPRDVIAQVQRYIRKEPIEELTTWYRNFKGSIVPSETKQGFDVMGVIEKVSPTVVTITELPVKKWTEDYKNFLTTLLSLDDPAQARIQDFKEYHTEHHVHFVVSMSEDQMQRAESDGFLKLFKLKSTIAITNMVCFSVDGAVTRYDTVKSIIEAFCDVRSLFYQKRKKFLCDKLRREKDFLSEKARFILLVIEGKIIVANRKKQVIIVDLKKHNFKTARQLGEKESEASTEDVDESPEKKDYDYLLGMPLWSLTWELVQDLKLKIEEKTRELDILMHTAPEEIWMRDLDVLLKALDERDEQYELEISKDKAGAKKRRGRALTREGRLRKAKRQRGTDGVKSEDENEPPSPAAKAAKAESSDGRPDPGISLLARLRQRQKARQDMVSMLDMKAEMETD